MNFEDLKEKIQDQATEIWAKIQDQPFYNSLRERYETLPVNAQRGIQAGLIFLVALLLLSLPYSYLSSSSNFIKDFENSRSLVRNLLRASRLAIEASSVPPTMTPNDLKGRIQNDLSTFSLLPEQLGGVIDLDPKDMDSLAPATIRKEGVAVSIKKLNLKQIVEIGFQLQAINPSVKMAGMEMTASAPDPHYFDVLYKLVIFSLPEMPKTTEEMNAGKGSAVNRPPPIPSEVPEAKSGDEEPPPVEQTE